MRWLRSRNPPVNPALKYQTLDTELAIVANINQPCSTVMASDSEQDAVDAPELEDDLFGDENEDEEVPRKARGLDDSELDSGDDEGRHDRVPGATDGEGPSREARVMESTLWRHPRRW